MTEERKEPTLSPLKPDQDEIIRHRQRTEGTRATPSKGGSGGGSGAGGSGSGGGGTSGSQPPKQVIVRSKLAPFALLLALAGLALAGFSYWQLLEAQKRSDAALARIAELERRLDVTGDESEASLAALQAKLKWADSEIRKLWGVAYDTNRKAIAENKEAIAAANKQAGSVETRFNTVAGELRGEIRNITERFTERLDAQQASVKEIEQARLAVQKQAQQAIDAVRQVQESQTSLQNRIKTNEQAIEAIDTFRRTVNRELLELKSRTANSAGSTTP